jgi:putative transposase
LIREYGWIWLTRLKRIRLRRSEALRHVNLDKTGNRPVHEVVLAATGSVVHLKGYGFVKVFKIVAPNGDIDYWATNNLGMTELQRLQFAEFSWAIERCLPPRQPRHTAQGNQPLLHRF